MDFQFQKIKGRQIYGHILYDKYCEIVCIALFSVKVKFSTALWKHSFVDSCFLEIIMIVCHYHNSVEMFCWWGV